MKRIGLGKKKNPALPGQIWAFLGSMRVGIVSLLILAGMSVYGSLLPHGEAMEQVYSSWWFVSVIALIALSLVTCSIRRIRGVWRRANRLVVDVDESTLRSYKNQHSLTLDKEPEEAVNAIYKFLKRRGYRAVVVPFTNGSLISADKGRFSSFGSIITHVSIVLILLAGLYGITGRHEHYVTGFPGRYLSLPDEDFSVRVDDFYIAYRDDPQRSIAQYYSELTVVEGGHAVKQETISVNNPLRHKGFVLYQANYGWGISTEIVEKATGERYRTLLSPGQTFHHQATGSHIHVGEFLPDPEICDQGTVVSSGAYPANPYVSFLLVNPSEGEMGGTNYVEPFNKPTQFHEDYYLQFVGYQGYTGILVVRDPATGYALIASMLLILGLIMSFYLYHRRIWVFCDQSKREILLAGHSNRNKVGFQMEFKRLAKAIQKRMET